MGGAAVFEVAAVGMEDCVNDREMLVETFDGVFPVQCPAHFHR